MWAEDITVEGDDVPESYSQVKLIDPADFQKEILESKLPVLLCFWEVECRTCDRCKNIIYHLQQEYQDNLKTVLIEYTRCSEEFKATWKISDAPTIVFFTKGMEKFRFEKIIDPVAISGVVREVFAEKNPIRLQFWKFEEYEENARCNLRFEVGNIAPYVELSRVSLKVTTPSFEADFQNTIEKRKRFARQTEKFTFDPKPKEHGLILIRLNVEVEDQYGKIYFLEGDTAIYVRDNKTVGQKGVEVKVDIKAEKILGNDFSNFMKMAEANQGGERHVIKPVLGDIDLSIENIVHPNIPKPVHKQYVTETPGKEEVLESLVITFGETNKRIFIFTKPEIRIGRQRMDKEKTVLINDIVLRIYPDGDEETVKIGRRHATVTLKDGQFYIKDWDWLGDKGSKNGTFINGKEIPKGIAQRLDSGDIIDFSGALQLQFTCLKDKDGGHACAKLIKFNNWQGKEEYFILMKKITLGKDNSNDIVIPHDSISDRHLIFHLENNRLWVENYSDEKVKLGNMFIAKGPLYLLRWGTEIVVGDILLSLQKPEEISFH